MLAEIISLFSSAGAGGIIGIIGGLLTKKEERALIREKNAHDLALANVRLREYQFEARQELAVLDKQKDLAITDGEIRKRLADIAAIQTGLESEAEPSGIKWIDGVRKMTRMILTYFAMALTIYILVTLTKAIGGITSLSQTELTRLYLDVIDKLIFLSMTIFFWWFSSRPPSRK